MDRDLMLLAFAIVLVLATGALWLRLVTLLLQGRWPLPIGTSSEPHQTPTAPQPQRQIEANS